MSDGRIDYAANAQELINGLQGKHVAPEQAQATLALAQVDATLALVGQQRIANMIALFSAGPDALGDRLTRENFRDMARQVREGLGL